MAADPWIDQHLELIPEQGLILDLACGKGRHSHIALQRGYAVIALDRDISHFTDAAITPKNTPLELLQYNIETQAWPFPAEFFAGIVVCNYLHRPLFPQLIESLSSNGVLIYTTFAEGNQQFGKPTNPDFLLQTDELKLMLAPELEIIDFQQGPVEVPRPAVRQSIVARKSATKLRHSSNLSRWQ